MKILLVVGSRDIDDKSRIFKELKGQLPFDMIVSSNCKGPSIISQKYAKRLHKRTKCFKPEWDSFAIGLKEGEKNPAGVIKSKEMILWCNEKKIMGHSVKAIAFLKGNSKGTTHEIDEIRKQRIPLKIIPMDKGAQTLDSLVKLDT